LAQARVVTHEESSLPSHVNSLDVGTQATRYYLIKTCVLFSAENPPICSHYEALTGNPLLDTFAVAPRLLRIAMQLVTEATCYTLGCLPV
jgi:hypothetical protein